MFNAMLLTGSFHLLMMQMVLAPYAALFSMPAPRLAVHPDVRPFDPNTKERRNNIPRSTKDRL